MSSAKKKSLALWIPFLWYAAVSTRGLGDWFTPDAVAFDYEKGSPIDRSFFLVLILAGVLVLAGRRIQWGSVIRSNRWLFWILVYTLISILWSDFPFVAFKRWIKQFGSVVIALVVLTEFPQVESISTVLRRCFLLHIPIDVILIKYYRSIGVGWDYTGGEMWIGLTKQKNSLGQILMTAATYFSWDSLRKLRESLLRLNVNILYILMILWLLIGPGEGRSITSISALLVGVGVVVGLHFAPKSRKILDRFFIKSVAVLLFFLMVLGLGMGAFHADWTFFGGFLEMTGREQTLTGRTELWMDMLEIAKENPISGVGYGSFWIGDKANNLWERHIWGPQEGHNGYLDVYIELGIIGLLLFGFFLFGTFRVIRDMLIEDFEFGVFRMAFFIMILVHNLAESSFLRSDHNLWFILVLIAINIPDAIRVGDDSADPDAA